MELQGLSLGSGQEWPSQSDLVFQKGTAGHAAVLLVVDATVSVTTDFSRNTGPIARRKRRDEMLVSLRYPFWELSTHLQVPT